MAIMENLDHNQWKGKTEGTTWMHQSLIIAFRYLNLRIVYVVMGVLVIPFYMLFAHKGYISMFRFFRQRFGFSSLKSFRYVYLNHYRFGQIILDRFAAYAGKRFDFEIINYDAFRRLVDDDKGLVMISSHVGNYELAGYSLKADKKRYNALVYSGEAQTVMENRNRILSANNIRMIAVQDDMSHLFLMSNALSDGEVLSIPGDRIFGSPRCVACDFFGAQAKFPLGPFAIAVQRDVPLLAIFVMKETVRKYKIQICRIEVEGKSNRERAVSAAQHFAKLLEETVRQYPEQWFNYYDFWR